MKGLVVKAIVYSFRHSLRASIAMSVLALIGCSDAPVGSKNRPFTMYFIPSVDAEKISSNAKPLTDYVSKKVSQGLYGQDSGFYIKSAVPTSYIAVVEAFGTNKADFAAFTTFSYILTRDIKKYDVEAVLTVIRGDNERTYRGQIIAHKDSGVKKLEDLKGKKFAYTDPASTSGFILPTALLAEKNIDLGETVFAHKHDNVVTMIYQKQVDAGATYYNPPKGKRIRDARARVKTQFPDVEDKIKIVGFTEEIPNDPWVLRKNLDKDPTRAEKIKSLVIGALTDFSKTETGKKALYDIYSIDGVVPTSDQNYDRIRKLITSSKINIEEILATKGAKKRKKS